MIKVGALLSKSSVQKVVFTSRLLLVAGHPKLTCG